MTTSASPRRLHWWQRRGPSFLVFCVVLGAMAIASFTMWNRVSTVLPDVGKDKQGEDPWVDPLGVEKVAQFQIAHIPDCGAAPVIRIALWDEDSRPYWEVSGPATPMASFAIGVTPEGFTADTPYKAPPAGAVLRLLVVRKVKGVAGVRFQTSDLRTSYVATGEPIKHYLLEDFQTGDVCRKDKTKGSKGSKGSKGATTTTTSAGG